MKIKFLALFIMISLLALVVHPRQLQEDQTEEQAVVPPPSPSPEEVSS